jgi:cell wall-associated NlpC family hydrolase
MRRAAIAVLLACASAGAAEPEGFWTTCKQAIEKHLGRPYVWGATGLKSFDCSGFVWRVCYDSGVLMKRTTARKLYVCLPAAPGEQRWAPGNLVFFDNLKHVGIVNDANTFYHAESSKGTNLSKFDPYWRRKVCGVRTGPWR